MSEQYNSLGAKTKSVDQALKYTEGDIEKAKAMVSGQFLDLVAVKGKFIVPSYPCSGMFVMFVNTLKEYIPAVLNVATSKTALFDKVRIFDDWKVFMSDINSYSRSDEVLDSTELGEYLAGSSGDSAIYSSLLENDLDTLTKIMSDLVRSCYDTKDIQCHIDLNKTSSLALEMAGIILDIPRDEQAAAEPEKKEAAIPAVEDKRVKEIEAEAKYIVGGSIIVSPVSGKDINNIDAGEMINVLLTGKDPVTKKLISVLNAQREDGTIAPVKGRVKGKIPLEKSGYILYALVAKGVLAKIIEEENVKIQLHGSSRQEMAKVKNDSKVILLVAVLFGLILLGAFVIMLIM